MDLPTPTPPPPEGSSSPEPTVLDWLRSILKRQPIPLPPREQPAQHVAEPVAGAPGTSEARALRRDKAKVIAPQVAPGPLAAVAEDADGAESAPLERPAIRLEIHIRAGHLRLPVALIVACWPNWGRAKPDNVLPTLVCTPWRWRSPLGGLEGDRPAHPRRRPPAHLALRPTWLGAAWPLHLDAARRVRQHLRVRRCSSGWALACVMIACGTASSTCRAGWRIMAG
jgi:hypothetical protein